MKDSNFNLRINSETKKKWEAEAKKKGISLASLINLIMNQYIGE